MVTAPVSTESVSVSLDGSELTVEPTHALSTATMPLQSTDLMVSVKMAPACAMKVGGERPARLTHVPCTAVERVNAFADSAHANLGGLA